VRSDAFPRRIFSFPLGLAEISGGRNSLCPTAKGAADRDDCAAFSLCRLDSELFDKALLAKVLIPSLATKIEGRGVVEIGVVDLRDKYRSEFIIIRSRVSGGGTRRGGVGRGGKFSKMAPLLLFLELCFDDLGEGGRAAENDD